MQLKIEKQKGCQIFVVKMDEVIDEEEKELKENSFEAYPYLHDFRDVFPKDLPGLPPKRVFNFAIDIIPGSKLMSKAPYQMTTTDLMEHKAQLQKLLSKGLIRPSVSPLGVPVIFVKKKYGTLCHGQTPTLEHELKI